MFYEFPRIDHIDEILEAIKGRDEFIVKHDPVAGMKIVNYQVNFEDTFPPVVDRRTALLRECRGITFCDKTGKVLNRKFHKFFNLNERPETRAETIDFTKPHVILEKLDGSMITPVEVDGEIRWCTKMGLTDVAKPVEEFVAQHPLYTEYARHMLKDGKTPIFEWCSRKQRIVIDYPEDQLILTAVRDNTTGKYEHFYFMQGHASVLGIPVVKALPGTAENIKLFMEQAYDVMGEEGYIIRFLDGVWSGHMLKVKGMWYCQLHKTLDHLRFEKDVIRLILDEKLDDAKAFLPQDLMDGADRFARDIFWHIAKEGERLYWIAQAAYDNFNGSKKRFALETVNGDPDNKPYAGLLFTIWDHLEEGEAGAAAIVRKEIACSTSSQGKVDSVRHLFGGVKWHDYGKAPENDD